MKEIQFRNSVAVGEYGFLSTWHLGHIRLGGEFFDSVERAYWMRKSILPADRERLKRAETQDVARIAETALPRPDWESLSDITLRAALAAKYLSNGALFSMLAKTGDAVILDADDEGNLLGKAIMSVRESLRRRVADAPDPDEAARKLRGKLAVAGTPRDYLLANIFVPDEAGDIAPFLASAREAALECRASLRSSGRSCIIVGLPDVISATSIGNYLAEYEKEITFSVQIGTEYGYALSFERTDIRVFLETPEAERAR